MNSGKHLMIFGILLTGKIIYSKCGSDKMEIINLHFNSLREKRFFDSGTPLITETSQNMFSSKPNYVLVSQHSVLKSGIQDEDNIFVFLEEPDVFIHIYGGSYPGFPNYRIDVIDQSIEKCSNETLCDKLSNCVKAEISYKNKEKLNNKAVYLSFQKINNSRNILLQYRNLITVCSDTGDILSVEQIVIHGLKKQDVSSYTYDFKVTSTTDQIITSDRFILPEGSLFCLEVVQCLHCQSILQIRCDNDLAVVSNSKRSKIMFSNGTVAPAWQTTCLSGPQETSTCRVHILTKLLDDFDGVIPFWGLTHSARVMQDDGDLEDLIIKMRQSVIIIFICLGLALSFSVIFHCRKNFGQCFLEIY